MKYYFSTSGRASRVEYIIVTVLYPFVIGTIDWLVLLLKGSTGPIGLLPVALAIVAMLAATWMAFACLIRRMHDLNFSGKWLLIVFPLAITIAVMGFGLPLLVALGCGKMALLFCSGDKQKNKFGEVPTLLGGFWENKPSSDRVQSTGRIDFKL